MEEVRVVLRQGLAVDGRNSTKYYFNVPLVTRLRTSKKWEVFFVHCEGSL